MEDYKMASDAFLAKLPEIIDQRRPDLIPELRTFLVAVAPYACNGLVAGLVSGPNRLKMIRFFFEELCGLLPATSEAPNSKGDSEKPTDS